MSSEYYSVGFAGLSFFSVSQKLQVIIIIITENSVKIPKAVVSACIHPGCLLLRVGLELAEKFVTVV